MWTIQILYVTPDEQLGEVEGWNDWSGRNAYETIELAADILLQQLQRPFLKKHYQWRLFCHDTQEEIPSDIFQE